MTANNVRIAEIRAENHQGDVSYKDIEWLCNEFERLNEWADGFSDAQLKERVTGEEYQRELRTEIERLCEVGQEMFDALVNAPTPDDIERWAKALNGNE